MWLTHLFMEIELPESLSGSAWVTLNIVPPVQANTLVCAHFIHAQIEEFVADFR